METKILKSIPIDRVLQKLDYYFSKNDYVGAENLLNYWFKEANSLGDEKGEFSVCNELVGLYRKTNQKEKALLTVDRVFNLIKKLKLDNEVSGATAKLNCATCYKAFGLIKESLTVFEQALSVYENCLDEFNEKKAGLYNNYALSLVEATFYDKAKLFYEKALKINEMHSNELDYAITLLNIANLVELTDGENGESKISELLEKAYSLLYNHEKKDGYYAFVCEKCSSTFGYYGFFAYEKELKKQAELIYSK